MYNLYSMISGVCSFLDVQIILKRVLIRKEKKTSMFGKFGLVKNFGGRNIFYFLKNGAMELWLVMIMKLRVEERRYD